MSMGESPNETYLSKLRNLEPWTPGLNELLRVLSLPDSNSTKVFLTNSDVEWPIKSPSDLLQRSLRDPPNGDCVCVIENISPAYIDALGSGWNLDPRFFAGHAWNPAREDLWPSRLVLFEQRSTPSRPYEHLDGIFEYPNVQLLRNEEHDSSPNYFYRHCFSEPEFRFRPTPYGIPRIKVRRQIPQSNTRISYYRVARGFYLFLVDAPLNLQKKYAGMDRRHRPSLRLKYAMNRGGIQLPRLLELDDRYGIRLSIFESMRYFFQHAWHMDLLFSNENDLEAFPGAPLLYAISSSLWKSNLQYLTEDIKRISFMEIRNPDAKTNDVLHDRREDLAYVKSGLTETVTYVMEGIRDYFSKGAYYIKKKQWYRTDTPVEALEQTLKEAVDLDTFLMETFQLLMSSTSVQEAQLSSQQALVSSRQSLRATQLTLLASIYVPLSFVTGVFGMNLKEINGSNPSIWVSIVGMVIAAVITAILFWALDEYSQRRKNLVPNSTKVT